MKTIAVNIMGGLGNQMFEYAAMRSYMLEYNAKGIMDLGGITNITHNVYTLDKLNISKDVIIKNKYFSFKKILARIWMASYYRIFSKNKKLDKLISNNNHKLSSIGIFLDFCIKDSIPELKRNSNYIFGYFQSYKYFEKHFDTIKSELKVKSKVSKKNIDYYNKMQKTNSVCLHIRRGDYMGSSLQICNDKYYYDAIKLMNSKVKNPTYFIFSDDIEWVEKNMDFGDNKVIFIKNKNKNYEELQLMYSCKNFIMSNSSFSYWAQCLSDNKKKIVIAPSKWIKDSSIVNIYEPNWLLIDVENKER